MDFLWMEFSLSEERARSAFYPSIFLQFFLICLLSVSFDRWLVGTSIHLFVSLNGVILSDVEAFLKAFFKCK
jgi:hypothetical protein